MNHNGPSQTQNIYDGGGEVGGGTVIEMTEPLYDSSSYVICIHFKSPPICPEPERPCLIIF